MEKVSQKKDREYKGRTGKSGKPQGENRRPERAGQKDEEARAERRQKSKAAGAV